MIKEKDRIFDKKQIDFVKLAPALGMVSLGLVLVSLVLIFTMGFRYGIDFSGGTEIQVKFTEPVDAGKVRGFTEQMGFASAVVQALDDGLDEYIIRFEALSAETDEEANRLNNELIERVTGGLRTELPLAEAGLLRVDSVGPQVGSDLKRDGLLAVFYALLMILIYIGLRFDFRYAPGAVICLFHDTVLTLGIFALFSLEVNVQVLAAILTIIGYSLNDTIINFDRIRENESLFRETPLPALINKSVNEVLSRSIITSGTTLIAVICLYVFADGVIRDLAFTLGIGVVIGTYSSIYVAAPTLMLVQRWSQKTT